MTWLLELALFTGIGLVWSGRTSSKRRMRALLLDFVGPEADLFQDCVARVVAKKCVVVPSSDLNGAMPSVELAVTGVVEARPRDYRLRIGFLAGATGRTIHSVTVFVRTASLDASAFRLVDHELDRAITLACARSSRERLKAG